LVTVISFRTDRPGTDKSVILRFERISELKLYLRLLEENPNVVHVVVLPPAAYRYRIVFKRFLGSEGSGSYTCQLLTPTGSPSTLVLYGTMTDLTPLLECSLADDALGPGEFRSLSAAVELEQLSKRRRILEAILSSEGGLIAPMDWEDTFEAPVA
jgi:hypothetical protein